MDNIFENIEKRLFQPTVKNKTFSCVYFLLNLGGRTLFEKD